jgi:hypothetical protein
LYQKERNSGGGKVLRVLYVGSGIIYCIFLLSYYLSKEHLVTGTQERAVLWLNVTVALLYILGLPYMIRKLVSPEGSKSYQDVGFYFIFALTILVGVLNWLARDYGIIFQIILIVNLMTS